MSELKAEPLLIAVGGGKGGVGKTVVAANLALSLARLGARVTAVDADLGSSNLHTVFGIDQPGLTLQALLDGRVANLQEVVIPSGQPRVDLVPGSIAVPGAANVQHARKLKLLRHLRTLDAEVVVVDCGAGIHFNVLDFFGACDASLVVANAQLISLQNAYGFLKAAIYRNLRQQAAAFGKGELLETSSDASETESLQKVLDRLAARDPGLAQLLREGVRSLRVSLLGNQLSDLYELNAVHALARMVRDFLGFSVPVLGGLRRLDKIHQSVTRRRPFACDAGADPESQLLLSIAEHMLSLNPRALREERACREQSLRKSLRSADAPSGTFPIVSRDDAPSEAPERRRRSTFG